jgi:hypothetical protein
MIKKSVHLWTLLKESTKWNRIVIVTKIFAIRVDLYHYVAKKGTSLRPAPLSSFCFVIHCSWSIQICCIASWRSLLDTPVRSGSPEMRDEILFFREVASRRLFPLQFLSYCVSVAEFNSYWNLHIKFYTIWNRTVGEIHHYLLRSPVDLNVNVSGVGV